uniref:Conjugal transfer protein TraD n=3 Tax=Bursaphelenchus xylophilus TaxID=6326 RepID=A0A1I7S8H4_BURXY
MRLRKGPSSPTTVLSLAGLFVCGILMILSGLLVVLFQDETPFIITGSIFLGTGSIMLLTCLILQRKNLVKFMIDMNRDLYFLNMSDSYMWRLMFDQKQSDLPVAAQ